MLKIGNFSNSVKWKSVHVSMFAVMDDGALVPQCSSAVASVTLNDWTVDTVDRAKNALYKRGRPMSRMHIRSIMHLYCYCIKKMQSTLQLLCIGQPVLLLYRTFFDDGRHRNTDD